jgi:hypothetical protein
VFEACTWNVRSFKLYNQVNGFFTDNVVAIKEVAHLVVLVNDLVPLLID